MDRNKCKFANVHILSQTPVLTQRQDHRKVTRTTTTTVSATTEIILSDASINIITIIEIKTQTALKAANEHVSVGATLVVINAIYFYHVT
jgi:hypothetical protein